MEIFVAEFEKSREIMNGPRKGQTRTIKTQWIVFSETLQAATEKAEGYGERNKELLGVLNGVCTAESKNNTYVPDAEELLLEMERLLLENK